MRSMGTQGGKGLQLGWALGGELAAGEKLVMGAFIPDG